MKLTTKGRYAVTAMLDLCIHSGKGPITLADISERQNISLSYLEQLFAKLRQKELVTSTRGPGGGYSLSRAANAISVVEIITAADESVDTTRCAGLHNCQNDEPCLTHELWSDLSSHIRDFLTNITLADLAIRKGIQDVAIRQEQILAKETPET